MLPGARPRGQVPRIAPAFGRRRRGPAMSPPISSAWTSRGKPARASSGMTARRSASVAFGNSSIPEWQRNALKPTTPAAIRAPTCPPLPGHDPAVEAAIDPELARCGPGLHRQGLGRRRDGRAVERHVHEGRDPARGGRAGRRGESFPLGPPGLVDVDVDIDQPRQDGPIAHVLDPAGFGQLLRRDDVDDRLARDHDRRRADARRRDHAPAQQRPEDPGGLAIRVVRRHLRACHSPGAVPTRYDRTDPSSTPPAMMRRNPIVSIVLTEHSYGKTRIRLTKVTRRADRHDVRELTIEIQLEGDFAGSYTTGDNRSDHPDGHDEERRLRDGRGAHPGLDRGLRPGAGGPLPRASRPRRAGDGPAGRASDGADPRRRRRASPRLRRPGPRVADVHASGAVATACTSSRASPTCSCSRRRTRRSPVSSATDTRRCPTPPTASWPRCSRPTGSRRPTTHDRPRLERRARRGPPGPDRDLRRPPQPLASSRRSTPWAPPCSTRARGSSGSR